MTIKAGRDLFAALHPDLATGANPQPASSEPGYGTGPDLGQGERGETEHTARGAMAAGAELYAASRGKTTD